ncbi:UNVERIFIED_ORG: hypothetical protein M2414_004209 [Rahnella aquatilis]
MVLVMSKQYENFERLYHSGGQIYGFGWGVLDENFLKMLTIGGQN